MNSLQLTLVPLRDLISEIDISIDNHFVSINGLDMNLNNINCNNLHIGDVSFSYDKNDKKKINTELTAKDIGLSCASNWYYTFLSFQDMGSFHFTSDNNDIRTEMEISKKNTESISNTCNAKLDFQDIEFNSEGISAWVLNQMKDSIVELFINDIEKVFCDSFSPFFEDYIISFMKNIKKNLIEETRHSKDRRLEENILDLKNMNTFFTKLIELFNNYIIDPDNTRTLFKYLSNFSIPVNTILYENSAFNNTLYGRAMIENVKIYNMDNIGGIAPIQFEDSQHINTTLHLKNVSLGVDLGLLFYNKNNPDIFSKENVELLLNLDEIYGSLRSQFKLYLNRFEELKLGLFLNAYSNITNINRNSLSDTFSSLFINCVIPNTTSIYINNAEIYTNLKNYPNYVFSNNNSVFKIVQDVTNFMFEYYENLINPAIKSFTSRKIKNTVNELISDWAPSCPMYNLTPSENILFEIISDIYNIGWIDIVEDIISPLTKKQSNQTGLVIFKKNNKPESKIKMNEISISGLDNFDNITFKYNSNTEETLFSFNSENLETIIDLNITATLSPGKIYYNSFKIITDIKDVFAELLIYSNWNNTRLYDLSLTEISIPCLISSIKYLNITNIILKNKANTKLVCEHCDLEILRYLENTDGIEKRVISTKNYLSNIINLEKFDNLLEEYKNSYSGKCEIYKESEDNSNNSGNLVNNSSQNTIIAITSLFIGFIIVAFLYSKYKKNKKFREKQKEDDLYNTSPDEVKPFVYDKRISVFVRFGIPVILLGNICLFLYGHLSTGALVAIEGYIGKDKLEVPELSSFSLGKSVKDIWKSGAYLLALVIGIFSGLWPYIKILSMLYGWIFKFKNYKIRNTFLKILEYIGKWSLIDMFILMITIIGFYIRVKDTEYTTIPLYDIELKIVPKLGLVFFCGAALSSIIVNNIIVHYSHKLEPFVENSLLTKKQKNKNIFSAVCYVISILCVIIGSAMSSFYFKTNGVAGLTVSNGGYTNYNLYDITSAFIYNNRNESSETLIGIYIITALYFLVIILAPIAVCLLRIIRIIYLYKNEDSDKLFLEFDHYIDIFATWTSLDVFCASLIVSVLEMKQVSEKIIGNACDLVIPILKNIFVPLGLIENPVCYQVETGFKSGFYILICSIIFYFIGNYLYQRPLIDKNARVDREISLPNWF